MTTFTYSDGYNGSGEGLKRVQDYDLFPSRELLALYEFGEGAGGTLVDTSGNGNHGQIIPGTGGWVAQGSGWAYNFAGDTFVDLPFGISGALTFAVVCKPTFANSNTFRPLVTNMADGFKGVALAYQDLAAFGTAVVWGQSNGSPNAYAPLPDVAFDEPWRCMALSLDETGAGHLANLSLGTVTAVTPPGYISSSGRLCIGGNRSHAAVGSVIGFSGKIAAVAVWGRRLAAAPSPTDPAGATELEKIRQFANADILAARGISV